MVLQAGGCLRKTASGFLRRLGGVGTSLSEHCFTHSLLTSPYTKLRRFSQTTSDTAKPVIERLAAMRRGKLFRTHFLYRCRQVRPGARHAARVRHIRREFFGPPVR